MRTSEQLQVMLKEYELLNGKVNAQAQKMFRLQIGMAGGAVAFTWYYYQHPESLGGLSLLSSFLLHAFTVVMLHSHLVVLTLKRTMRQIAKRINSNSPDCPLLIWEEHIWWRHWGGIERLRTPLTCLVGACFAAPLVGTYAFLVPAAYGFVIKESHAWVAIAYVGLMCFLVAGEIVVPLVLRERLRSAFLNVDKGT